MKRLIYLAPLVIFLAACGKGNSTVKRKPVDLELKAPRVMQAAPVVSGVEVAEEPANSKETVPSAKNATEVSKKVIKDGDISFETNNIAQARNTINNSLAKLGGYIGRESETNSSDNNRKEYNLNIRVPAKNFDQFLNGVVSIAEKIDSKNIRRTDVTTEYIDIITQLANKKKLEKRYLKLLKKANRMADMLEIENKLTEIRTDIESTQGRLNYLVKQVEYSSLDITFYSRQLVQDNGNTFGYKLKSTLADGWVILGVLFFGFLQFWPIWIMLAVFIYFTKRWRRKNKEKKERLVSGSSSAE